MQTSNARSKFDVLQKYAPTKKVKTESVAPKNMLKVYDRELEGLEMNRSDGEDDENKPMLIETDESSKISFEVKNKLLKSGTWGAVPANNLNRPQKAPQSSGKWVAVDQNKPAQESMITTKKDVSESSSDESSDDERKGRGRHDTDSEGEDDDDRHGKGAKIKNEIKQALGVDDKDEAGEKMEEDDDEDLDVVRKKDVETIIEKPKVGGLKTVQELKLESQQDKKKQEMLANLAEQFKDASTVYRDKEGKRMNIFKDLETRKKDLLKANEDRIKQWSGGLVQKKEVAERKQQLQTAADDFEKTGVSKEYDTQLMEQKRFGDNMAGLIEKDQKKEEKTKKLGPKLRCKFVGPPNRFGILPGRMWDGVDRGNGFERRMAEKINEKKDREDMANQWAMQEM